MMTDPSTHHKHHVDELLAGALPPFLTFKTFDELYRAHAASAAGLTHAEWTKLSAHVIGSLIRSVLLEDAQRSAAEALGGAAAAHLGAPATVAAVTKAATDGAAPVLDRLFAVLDRDGDGRVSRAEFALLCNNGDGQATLRAAFAVLDADGSGAVSQAEAAAFAGRRENVPSPRGNVPSP